MEAWHWLQENRRLRWGTEEVVEVGKTISFDGKLVLCESGLHASVRAIDSLQYAPGPLICRVVVGGTIVEGDDKVVASERTVLWMADATNALHEFACRCAEQALKTAKVEDRRYWEAIETKRRWLRGEATDEQLDAAWDAAWAAARAAARDAALDAAWAAAWAAAWVAARDAAWDAAWAAARAAARDAAWVAARDAQNQQLHDMLMALSPSNEATG